MADVVPLSEVFNDLGAAQNRRNLPQAIESFRKALEGDPNDPVYHFNLGYALWKKGDYAAAADRFRAVLDRQPDDEMATLMLGLCLEEAEHAAGRCAPGNSGAPEDELRGAGLSAIEGAGESQQAVIPSGLRTYV